MIALLEHQADSPAGLLGDWLAARHLAFTVVRPDDECPDPRDVMAFISLGCSSSAYAEEPEWIAAEVALLAAAVGHGTPVLGLCFGAQTLALGLGGRVARAARPEVGWVWPRTRESVLSGPWGAWHFDAVTPPPRAAVLAETDAAVQAFALGPHLGVQFHPELTEQMAREWAMAQPDALHPAPANAFVEQIRQRADALRRRAFALCVWWWLRCGAGTNGPTAVDAWSEIDPEARLDHRHLKTVASSRLALPRVAPAWTVTKGFQCR